MLKSFNHGWIFQKQGQKSCIVNLPHDAMLTEKRYANCVNGKQCAFFPGGKYIYKKTLHIEPDKLSFYTALLFEGVYRYATIKLNGTVVHENNNGFSDFLVDLSGKLAGGDNEIEVIADNTLTPNCRWYTGSGIYRPVWLIQKERKLIDDVKITTLSHTPAIINVDVQSKEPAIVIIYDKDTIIYEGIPGNIEIKVARLWSVDSPYLYKCAVKCGSDREELTFGIRTVEAVPGKGLFINGQETLLRGGCIHSDNGILGACSYKNAEYRKVRILKEAGFNAIRCAHNPCSRYFLEACDELGMFIIDEAFDGWYTPKEYHDYSRDFWNDYKNTLSRMVAKDFNHPCVIMYSVGNEVSETAKDEGIQLLGEMTEFVKSIDRTRPVTCGINLLINVYDQMGIGIYKDKGNYKREPLPDKTIKVREKKNGSEFFNYWTQKLGGLFWLISHGKRAERNASQIAEKLDIIGLNYGSSRYLPDGNKYPERLMLGTETMAWDLPYNWEQVKNIPGLIGDFVWAAWDYLGEAGVGAFTYYSYKGLPLLAGSGVIDLCGNITAECEFMRIVWGLREKPYICVKPLNHAKEIPYKSAWRFTDGISSWNWQGYEGEKTFIEVYSSAPIVRLLLNGKEIGTKKLKKHRAVFRTRYEAGILTAVALDEKGNELSRESLNSGSNVKLTAAADKTKLIAGDDDLSFVEICFTDEYGSLAPYIEQPVELEINGESIFLQGFGSAQTKTDEVFDKPTHKSYRGFCLAAIRASDIPGAATLIVKSAGFQPVTIEYHTIVKEH